MKLHTDIEVAKQLEDLWHTIERGITVASDAAQQAGAIHAAIIQHYSKIEQLKLDTSEFTHTIQHNIDEVKHQQLHLEQNIQAVNHTRDEIISQLEQIETNKQEIARYQEITQHQTNEVTQAHSQIQTIKTDIETVITNFGGKQALDNLHLENQSIQNQLQQAQTEIERLHQKLETQTKKQKQFNNWLIILSLGLTLTLIFTIMR